MPAAEINEETLQFESAEFRCSLPERSSDKARALVGERFAGTWRGRSPAGIASDIVWACDQELQHAGDLKIEAVKVKKIAAGTESQRKLAERERFRKAAQAVNLAIRQKYHGPSRAGMLRAVGYESCIEDGRVARTAGLTASMSRQKRELELARLTRRSGPGAGWVFLGESRPRALRGRSGRAVVPAAVA